MCVVRHSLLNSCPLLNSFSFPFVILVFVLLRPVPQSPIHPRPALRLVTSSAASFRPFPSFVLRKHQPNSTDSYYTEDDDRLFLHRHCYPPWRLSRRETSRTSCAPYSNDAYSASKGSSSLATRSLHHVKPTKCAS